MSTTKERIVNAAIAITIGLVPSSLAYCQATHETDMKYEIAKVQANVSYDTLAKAVSEVQQEVMRMQLLLGLTRPSYAGAGSAGASMAAEPDMAGSAAAAFEPLPSDLTQAVQQAEMR